MKAHFISYNLIFKKPAGTSRGTLHVKETYFLIVHNGVKKGIGECNLFKGLSIDDRPGYEQKLQWLCDNIKLEPAVLFQELATWPSLLMGYETAMKSLQATDPFTLYPSLFTTGQDAIPVNGLVWMGAHDFMLQQLEEKLTSGFNCIKFKIGAIDFEQEMQLLKKIRERFSAQEITIRVDANGAFTAAQAPALLERLASYQVHSIEQPIKQGQWQEMAALCEITPVPIALDEELIGLYELAQREDCVATIKPQYIILKPALIGGFNSSRAWINIAESYNAGWWVTSALESNIGLNAIAQFTYTLGVTMPQGLGTGSLFTNNITSPLDVIKGQLWCNNTDRWDTNELNF
jgi:o-succinylbenzoate synthase